MEVVAVLVEDGGRLDWMLVVDLLKYYITIQHGN